METMSFTTHSSSPARRLKSLQQQHHLCATSRPTETTLGCVLIPSDFVMRDEAPPLIARFHNVKMKYYVVELRYYCIDIHASIPKGCFKYGCDCTGC